MARKREIDKDKVLDAAEAVILESGGRYFTLDAVAEIDTTVIAKPTDIWIANALPTRSRGHACADKAEN